MIGKWKLTEVLVDPGNGKGIFNKVASDKTLEFFSNGTVVSNGNLCVMDTAAGQQTGGTYSLKEKTIRPDNCQLEGTDLIIHFRLENDALVLQYSCMEPCFEKYVRIQK